jgi:hypothetical protein
VPDFAFALSLHRRPQIDQGGAKPQRATHCNRTAILAYMRSLAARSLAAVAVRTCIPPREAARPRRGAKSRDRQKGDNDGCALPVDRPARALTSRAAARIAPER